jgi:hypothetical protein
MEVWLAEEAYAIFANFNACTENLLSPSVLKGDKGMASTPEVM